MAHEKELREIQALYDSGQSLAEYDVPSFRKLLEFDGHILAAELQKNGEFQFVTWFINHDRKQVCNGHYFKNFESAKEDFSWRAGLVEQDKIYNKEELTFLYNGLERLEYDGKICLTAEQYKSVRRLKEKIESVVPDVKDFDIEQDYINEDEIER